MSKWKTIFAHKWDSTDPTGETLYSKALKYLNGDDTVLNTFTNDSKNMFIKRLKTYYSLNHDRTGLEYKIHNIDYLPDWLKSNINEFPVVFTVINPDNINNTIAKYFDNVMFVSGNYKTVFDKILY